MKIMKTKLAAVNVVLALVFAAPVVAQTPGATVHGHVQNPVGQPLTSGTVQFTKDKTTPFKDEKFLNTVPIDGSGNYTAPNVAPGDYFVYVIQDGKAVDRQEVTFKAGQDQTLDFDMTRA